MNNSRWKKLDKLVIDNPITTIVIVSNSATNVVLDVRDALLETSAVYPRAGVRYRRNLAYSAFFPRFAPACVLCLTYITAKLAKFIFLAWDYSPTRIMRVLCKIVWVCLIYRTKIVFRASGYILIARGVCISPRLWGTRGTLF